MNVKVFSILIITGTEWKIITYIKVGLWLFDDFILISRLVFQEAVFKGFGKSFELEHLGNSQEPLRKIEVAICNHQVDRPFYLWPDYCSGDLQSKESVWPYMTLNVLTETRCHFTMQTPLKSAFWWKLFTCQEKKVISDINHTIEPNHCETPTCLEPITKDLLKIWFCYKDANKSVLRHAYQKKNNNTTGCDCYHSEHPPKIK